MIICKNCKKQIEDDSLFCRYCGTPVTPKNKEKDSVRTEQYREMLRNIDRILTMIQEFRTHLQKISELLQEKLSLEELDAHEQNLLSLKEKIYARIQMAQELPEENLETANENLELTRLSLETVRAFTRSLHEWNRISFDNKSLFYLDMLSSDTNSLYDLCRDASDREFRLREEMRNADRMQAEEDSFGKSGRWDSYRPPVSMPDSAESYSNYWDSDDTESRTEEIPHLSEVQFSAIAPKKIEAGEYAVLNIVMYEEEFRNLVDEIIRQYEETPQETRSGILRVEDNAQVKVVLTSPDYTVEDNEEAGYWYGTYLNFSFVVELPEDYAKKQVLYIAKVYINGILSSKLKFVIKRAEMHGQSVPVEREDYTSAFISYASEDRKRVATVIQGMKKARPDLDVFFDVESIRSGADWKSVLYREIDSRDILYLCWSKNAKASKWVEAEWRYALEHKGKERIDIVPIDPPELCSPPNELRDKHFNDQLLFIINANMTR